jgi:polyhydroxyalkanoate synthesis regulator phasin
MPVIIDNQIVKEMGPAEVSAGHGGNFVGKRKEHGLFACFYSCLLGKNQGASSYSGDCQKLIATGTVPAVRRNPTTTQRGNGNPQLEALNVVKFCDLPSIGTEGEASSNHIPPAASATPNQTDRVEDRQNRIVTQSVKQRKFAGSQPSSRIDDFRNALNTLLLRLKSLFGFNSAKGNIVIESDKGNKQYYETLGDIHEKLQKFLDLFKDLANKGELPLEGFKECPSDLLKYARSLPTGHVFISKKQQTGLVDNPKDYPISAASKRLALCIGDQGNYASLEQGETWDVLATDIRACLEEYQDIENSLISDAYPGRKPFVFNFDGWSEEAFKRLPVAPSPEDKGLPVAPSPEDKGLPVAPSPEDKGLPVTPPPPLVEDEVAIDDLIKEIQETWHSFEQTHFGPGSSSNNSALEFDQLIKKLQEFARIDEDQTMDPVLDAESGLGKSVGSSSQTSLNKDLDTSEEFFDASSEDLFFDASDKFSDTSSLAADGNTVATYGVYESINQSKTYKPTQL